MRVFSPFSLCVSIYPLSACVWVFNILCLCVGIYTFLPVFGYLPISPCVSVFTHLSLCRDIFPSLSVCGYLPLSPCVWVFTLLSMFRGIYPSLPVCRYLPISPCVGVFTPPWLCVIICRSLSVCGYLTRTGGRVPIVSLILSGVITGAIFTALLSIVQISVHERSLQTIVRWIMGSFNAVTWPTLSQGWLLIAVGTIVMVLLRWRLNVLALGDDEARSSGMNVERYKAVFIISAALVSAVAVAMAGIVALVGLIVPHMVRMIAGPDHRTLLPLSAALGATYLVLVDDLSRAAFGVEIPLSIITTLIGAPFFWLLLRTTKASGWE